MPPRYWQSCAKATQIAVHCRHSFRSRRMIIEYKYNLFSSYAPARSRLEERATTAKRCDQITAARFSAYMFRVPAWNLSDRVKLLVVLCEYVVISIRQRARTCSRGPKIIKIENVVLMVLFAVPIMIHAFTFPWHPVLIRGEMRGTGSPSHGLQDQNEMILCAKSLRTVRIVCVRANGLPRTHNIYRYVHVQLHAVLCVAYAVFPVYSHHAARLVFI